MENVLSSPDPAPAPVAVESKPSPAPVAPAPAPVQVAVVPIPARVSVWLRVAAVLVRLVYPLALMASVVFLFVRFGPSGWLWLVLLAALLLAVARPSVPRDL